MIKLELDEKDFNQMLNAVAQMPYIQVQPLIANILQQANKQVAEKKDEPVT